MSQEMIVDIGNLFIQIMSLAGSIALVMYFVIWLVNFLLGLVFPSRYGV